MADKDKTALDNGNGTHTGAAAATDTAGLVQIDLHAVIRAKLGSKARWIPRCLTNRLARLIRQDELNELLRHNYPRRGADFCRGVFDDLGVTIRVANPSQLPPTDCRRVIIVSNHPLGGLDGMALIDIFTRHYGGKVHFIVNDLLMAVEPLSDVFVPVNTHTAQSRRTICTIEDVLAGDDPVLIFPAGLCSRLGADGNIADLEWRKTFVTMACQYRRDIVPVYFGGANSPAFYRTARRRQRMGLRFNFEMVLLPREVFRSKGKTFDVVCGSTIPWQSLQGRQRRQAAQEIRNTVYSLGRQLSGTQDDHE